MCSRQDGLLTVFAPHILPQEEGDVDQEAGMLSEDVRSKGYALLCVSQPHGNVKVRIIPEVQWLASLWGLFIGHVLTWPFSASHPSVSNAFIHRKSSWMKS